MQIMLSGEKDNVRLYATALSDSYQSLIKSIVYDHMHFRPNVIILSDNGIDLDFYEKLKHFNTHIINALTVFYNKTGKDFDDVPVDPVKYVI